MHRSSGGSPGHQLHLHKSEFSIVVLQQAEEFGLWGHLGLHKDF